MQGLGAFEDTHHSYLSPGKAGTHIATPEERASTWKQGALPVLKIRCLDQLPPFLPEVALPGRTHPPPFSPPHPAMAADSQDKAHR